MIRNLAAGVQSFTSNAFLVGGERPVLVDVGANFDVVEAVREAGPDPEAVVLTHTHPDHVSNLDAITDAFDVPVYAFDPEQDGVEKLIADGETVAMGDHDYEVLHTPGHAEDHCCFHAPDAGVLFAGDLVFANGGFGRTDLAGGDRAALVESVDRIRHRGGEDLRELHAGHGPSVDRDAYAHVEIAAKAARRG